jgi:CII-binding regulator of phage lambda lysogenization HflD
LACLSKALDLLEYALMREIKSEAIVRIVKLVEAVNQGARRVAAIAAARDTNTAVHDFAEKIHETLNGYEFELRNELQRLAANSVIVSQGASADLRVGLQTIMETYRQTLARALTPHARAMINRQFREIERARDEFSSIDRAA